MSKAAQQIIAIICQSSQFSPQLIASLPGGADFSDALLEAAEQQALERNWGCICRLIWVMQRLPNKDFVPLLCKLLDERADEVYMEAVVDALNIMSDVRAIEPLRRALSYRMPGDDLAFHFNKKVIGALARIGTAEARTVIAEALQSSDEPIRVFAQDILRELEKESV